MSQEFKATAEEANAIDGIAAVLSERDTVRLGVTEAPEATDLCQTYQTIKGFLPPLLKFIRKIPIFGEKIATAIEFLMKLADTVCPA